MECSLLLIPLSRYLTSRSAHRSAKHSINFDTYVFWDGQIGREFTEALAERARAGVHVNAILDAQGTQKIGSN
jgi:cardiolipin synthase